MAQARSRVRHAAAPSTCRTPRWVRAGVSPTMAASRGEGVLKDIKPTADTRAQIVRRTLELGQPAVLARAQRVGREIQQARIADEVVRHECAEQERRTEGATAGHALGED